MLSEVRQPEALLRPERSTFFLCFPEEILLTELAPRTRRRPIAALDRRFTNLAEVCRHAVVQVYQPLPMALF